MAAEQRKTRRPPGLENRRHAGPRTNEAGQPAERWGHAYALACGPGFPRARADSSCAGRAREIAMPARATRPPSAFHTQEHTTPPPPSGTARATPDPPTPRRHHHHHRIIEDALPTRSTASRLDKPKPKPPLDARAGVDEASQPRTRQPVSPTGNERGGSCQPCAQPTCRHQVATSPRSSGPRRVSSGRRADKLSKRCERKLVCACRCRPGEPMPL